MDLRKGWGRIRRSLGAGAGILAIAATAFVGYAAIVPTGEVLLVGSKTTPHILTVHSAAGLPPEVQAQEAATAAFLFDRDTTTEHVAFDVSDVEAALEAPQEIRTVKVHGPAPYLLTVQAEAAGSYQTIAGLENVNLTQLPAGWSAFNATAPVTTGKLRLTLTPATGGVATGLQELEVWTTAAPMNAESGARLLAQLFGPTPPAHARLYPALNPTANPTVGVITPSGDDTADNFFHFTLDRDPAHVVRAYLTYELFGQEHWVSPRRYINDLMSNAGGALLLPTDTWSVQAERINPAWLQVGANTIEFGVLSSSFKEAGYTVRNVRVLIEFDNGANAIETIQANQPDATDTNPIDALYDGDIATGWQPYPFDQPINAAAPAIEFDFRRPTQMDAVSFYLSAPLAGELQVSVKQAGQWIDHPPEQGAVLSTGWNTIPVPSATPLEQRVLEGVRLTFLGGHQSSAEIREFVFTGSGVGARTRPPKFFVTYPDQGQFHGRQAYVQGFLDPWDNGSGTATITLSGRTVFHFAGAIGNTTDKEAAGFASQADNDPWAVEVKAVYPDGETVSFIVPLTAQQSQASAETGPLAAPASATLFAKRKANITHDESNLTAESGTVATDTEITITPLAEESVPALDVGMTNVTKGPRRGYRFLPHGAKFLKKINVKLPYNKALIPPGHTEDDVKTFYFDEQAGRWIALERAGVDKTNKMVTSLTDHFTDMINAVVTVPDHPEAVSFNPTSMKDIKAADPGAQVNLIEAPQVNNMGDARLSYPIEVPPGRQGLQPQLAVQYNSAGGNGWLGVGWDLSVPSITIDTRFGVPKYDETKREETYLLNGQQLVKLPNGEYRLRIEGAFNRIVRHGTGPGSYWWVVTDKNGTRQVFGGDQNAQLRSVDGARIFTWHLSRTVDSNGNTVDYVYEPKVQPVHNGGEPATFTFLKEIRYTGNTGPGQSDDAVRHVPAPLLSANYYRVLLHHDAQKRLDAVVDGRGGFKTVLDERLKTIEIDLIENGAAKRARSYVLNYKIGDFDKTLLTAIVQHDASGAEFNRHTFDYFTMPKTVDGYDGFFEREQWTVPAVGSALSRNKNRDRYTGGYFGLGVNDPTIHFGSNRGSGEGKSETEFTITDLNGDGLPDFLQQGGTYYVNNWRHDGAGATAFSGVLLEGAADQIGKDENKVRASDSGLNLDAAWMPFRLTASRGSSTTDNNGRKMMADINGDGLVDQLSVASGLRAALNNGDGFNAPIAWNGTVNITPPLSDTEKQEILDTYPLSDPVRAWWAPFKGVISFSGSVSKPQASDPAAGEDGVHIAIFKGTGLTPLWSKTFQAVETVNLSNILELQNLSVSAGERLYVKLSSIQTIANDTLAIDISITYREIRYIDDAGTERVISDLQNAAVVALPTGQPQFAFNSAADFALTRLARPDLDLDHRYGFSAPYKGQVILSQLLTKQVTAEDVLFQVVRFRADRVSGDITRETLFTRPTQAGEAFDESLPDIPIEVLAGDRLVFDVSLPKLGVLDATRFKWSPELRYVQVCMPARTGVNIDDPSTYIIGDGQTPEQYFDTETCTVLTAEQQQQTDQDVPGAEPPPGVAPTKLFIFNPTPLLNVYPFTRQQPTQAWVAPRDGLVRITASAFKNVETDSDIHIKVQSTNRLLAQHTFAAAAVQPNTQVIAVDVMVKAGQRLFFSRHSKTAIPKTATVFSGPDDTVGQEVPVFGWTPEILYIDPQHCYIDAQTNQETCVPVSTDYISSTQWNMHFDQLCLATDRCVPVDCTGTRTPGVPGERTADACVTTEEDTSTPPQTIHVPLTAAEREAFNLNRVQYIVPILNSDYLDWTRYASTPLQGFYRDWTYIAWNGNNAWDPARLEEPNSNPHDGLNLDNEDDQVEAGNRAGNRPYFLVTPLAPGNARHPGLPLWQGPGIDDFLAALLAQPSRVGSDVGVFLAEGANGGGIGELRKTRTRQNKKSLGAGPVGASLNEGPSITEIDLIDLNGDRYPDQVSGDKIIFNNGDGSFDPTPVPVDLAVAGDTSVRRSESKTAGLSFAIGHIIPEAAASGVIRGIKTLGPSIGTNYGSSRSRVDFIDINGDGLPDRVFRDGAHITVRLNLGGDRFGAAETWTAGVWDQADTSQLPQYFSISPNAVRVTDTVSANVGGGFIVSGSFSASGSRTLVDLTDINGDGLPDLVMKTSGAGAFRVRLNRGNGFGPEHSWRVPAWGFDIGRGATAKLYGGNDVLGYQESSTDTGGINFHYQWSIPIPFCCVLWIHAKVDGNLSSGEGGASMMMLDIDGDGAADHVFREGNETVVHVKRNKVGKTNLLKSVSRPLGARFELDYVREGNVVDRRDPTNIIEMNASKWVMSEVLLHDGQGNTYPTRYKHFTSGFYDRAERENYGFAHCQEIRADGAITDYFYHNQDYTRKGLLFRTVFRDKDKKLFTREENTYDVLTVQPAEGTRPPVRFPALTRKERHFYEGTQVITNDIAVTASLPNGVKRQAESYTYETQFGNVIALHEFADLDTPADDLEATLGYFIDPGAYIVKPASLVVSAGTAVLRQREATFAAGTGNLTQVRQAAGGGQLAVTDLTYEPNGNLKTVTGPANHATQRYHLTYDYDPTVATHVIRVADSFGLSSQAAYDFRFGKPTVSTDTNNNATTTTYDALGRIATLTGPYQQASGFATLSFDYHPEGSAGCAAPGAATCSGSIPFAVTKHFDIDALGRPKASGTIDTVLFTDGLKRVLQTKKDATVLEGNVPLDQVIVSGRVLFDAVGRVREQFYPVLEPLGRPGVFNNAFNTTAPATVTDYDGLGRVVKTTLPDASVTTIRYGFGPDRSGANQFETLVTDANVNALLKGSIKSTYKDARELITAVKEQVRDAAGALQPIWTSYAYDPIKQITQVTDDQGNMTTVTYDTLGRRTSINNPDTGLATFEYDLASNLTKKITANLRASAQAIEYAYDFNRLTQVRYPAFPGNNVSYTYGALGAPNNTAGRVAKVVSRTTTTAQGTFQDSEERHYGKLGEVIFEKKTVVTFTDPSHPSVFETTYNFDTFGRLMTLIYPDGEVLTNVYDSGGNLQATSGEKNGFRYDYLKRLSYDRFEQRVFLEAGNGVKTAYTYDAQTRRLNALTAGRANGNLFQNLAYTYDKVGNILSLKNTVDIPPASSYGGPTTQSFTYDELYRLTSASGSFQFAPDKTHVYTLDMGYDSIHNIRTKQQVHNLVQPSGVAISQKKTTYDWVYQYNPSGLNSVRPHAPTHIGERTFSYDANGNQTGWTHDRNGTNRTLVWNEENRVESISDQGHVKTYKYDDQGNRTIKRGPQGETVYVNQFFTQRPGATGTKHVYAGTSRIVSKLMRQDTPGANPQGNTPFEKDLYFFHPDHLGSSSYITDTNGKLYEHLEYFPFGEAWVEENSNTQRAPYLFTAKELDEETGLYYFGARYYDPRTSVWQSADPILEKYFPNRADKNQQVGTFNPQRELPGTGGVYNSFNLSLYKYSSQNPLRYFDPDGNIDVDANDAKKFPVLRKSVKGAETDLATAKGQAVFKKMFNADTKTQIIGSGKGPTVKVKPLEDAYGVYQPGKKSDVIEVDEGLVQKAESGDKKSQELLEGTIVHETGHWADERIKGGADTPGEEGEIVEQAIYGRVKLPSNVRGTPNEPYSPLPPVPEHPYP